MDVLTLPEATKKAMLDRLLGYRLLLRLVLGVGMGRLSFRYRIAQLE